MYERVPTNEFAIESISCPLTPKSHILISPPEFSRMLDGLTSTKRERRVQQTTRQNTATLQRPNGQRRARFPLANKLELMAHSRRTYQTKVRIWVQVKFIVRELSRGSNCTALSLCVHHCLISYHWASSIFCIIYLFIFYYFYVLHVLTILCCLRVITCLCNSVYKYISHIIIVQLTS